MQIGRRKLLKPPNLGPRLQRAFRYAAEKHEGQTRKQTAVPYLSHLMAVASLVLEAGGDEDHGHCGACCTMWWKIAAGCQGCAKSAGNLAREWRRLSRVARIRSASRSRSGWTRKKNYLREVKHADLDTRLVSASDKLHNVRTILADYRKDGEAIWARFSGRKKERSGTIAR